MRTGSGDNEPVPVLCEPGSEVGASGFRDAAERGGRPQLKTHCPRSGCGCGAFTGIGGLATKDAESGYER